MNFELIKKLPFDFIRSNDYLDKVIDNPFFILASEYSKNVELGKNELGTDMNYRYLLKG